MVVADHLLAWCLCRFRKYVDLYAKDEEAFFKVGKMGGSAVSLQSSLLAPLAWHRYSQCWRGKAGCSCGTMLQLQGTDFEGCL